MNDRWFDKRGERHSSTEMQNAQRRFRHHVVTNSNPNGRVLRMACTFCTREGVTQSTVSEAHHLDYKEWWRIVWCCSRHHRLIEHETVRITVRDIWDYSSLLIRYPKRGHNRNSDNLEAPF